MRTATLEGLLVDELKDIYNAENQIITVLPKLAEAVESDDLRIALERHLEERRQHAERIEQIFGQLDVEPINRKCLGMQGLVEESKGMLQSSIEPDLLNVALIGAVQRMEHYQLAAYGTARAHARQLGLVNIANLLGQTLQEDKEADRRLTELAVSRVNLQAAMRHGRLML